LAEFNFVIIRQWLTFWGYPVDLCELLLSYELLVTAVAISVVLFIDVSYC